MIEPVVPSVEDAHRLVLGVRLLVLFAFLLEHARGTMFIHYIAGPH